MTGYCVGRTNAVMQGNGCARRGGLETAGALLCGTYDWTINKKGCRSISLYGNCYARFVEAHKEYGNDWHLP